MEKRRSGARGPPRALFDCLAQRARDSYPRVGCGRFGAGWQVALTN